jgi:ADP-ribosylglycohydrolase
MKINSDQLVKKIHGCLMGVACGDAMGMPTSMMSPDAVKKLFPQGIDDFYDAPEGHSIHNGYKAGAVTDDTQQTLMVAEAILEDGYVNPTKIARNILQWAERVNAFDSLMLGPSSLRALRAIQNGEDIERAGSFGDTNGASMRISPVGIYSAGDINRTVDNVALACLPTHNTNIAIAGASAIAYAIGTAIAGESNIYTIIKKALDAADKGMAKGTPWLGASIRKRTELALHFIQRGLPREEVIQYLYDVIGTSTATTETVPTALAIVAYCEGDPVRTIKFAANLGGDADTIGAIAGGIAGAFAGLSAFPKEYVELIENVNQLNLGSYADRLADLITEKAETTERS